MRVLQVDAGREWRGGQQQVICHVQYQQSQQIETALLCPFGSPLWKKAESLNIPLFNWASPKESVLAKIRNCREAIHHWRPQIIQINDAGSLPVVMMAKPGPGAVIVAVRRVDFKVRKISSYCWYRRLDHLILVSGAIATIMNASGVPAEKMTVIPDGIDLNKFRDISRWRKPARKKFGISAETIHIGNAASLVDHKGQIHLITAAAILVKKFPGLFFSIAGSGPLRQQLQKKIGACGLEKNFRLLGFVEEMPQYYSSLDIYVHPSLLEGMGSVIIEAMASKLPVVASRAGGIGEAVSESGLLAEPGNPADLAQKLSIFIQDAGERGKWAEKSTIRAQEFAYQKTNQKMVALYKKLLSEKPDRLNRE